MVTKMPPYDFSDLQITGEIDNRPGTGRFSTFFPYVVTASVFDNIGRCPAFIEIDRASYFTDFIQMKQISRTMMYMSRLSFTIMLQKHVVKMGRKTKQFNGKKRNF